MSGSYRKHLSDIEGGIRALEKAGIRVLAPRHVTVKKVDGDFVHLQGDAGQPVSLEKRHLSQIKRSDLLYVVNPGGYIGQSTALEIGFALAIGVPVYCKEPPSDVVLQGLTRFCLQPEDIASDVEQAMVSQRNTPVVDFKSFQKAVEHMVMSKGFSSESPRDVVLLLVEEVGELARGVREETGLKVRRRVTARRKRISEELADCLIYLADLANLSDVDLRQAVQDKLAKTSSTKWEEHIVLSERELEIVRAISRGYAVDEIAARLHISRATVSRHIQGIKAKLGLADTAGILALTRHLREAEITAVSAGRQRTS